MPEVRLVMVRGSASIEASPGAAWAERSCAMPPLRTLQAADIAGIRALLVHAKDEKAVRSYQHYGFLLSPLDPLTLLLPLQDSKAALA